jgi:outer membrane protein
MRRLLTGVLTAALLLAVPLAARADTLADALIAAYRNSNLLDQNEAVLRAADEDFATAVAALRPVVSYALNVTQSFTRREFLGQTNVTNSLSGVLTLSADMTVWDFGRSQYQIEVAREAVLATRQTLVSVEQDVLLAAVEAYVSVKLAEEIVFLRQSNVRLITQELRAARDRFDVGEITRTDVSIAEARLAAARASLSSAEGDLLVARESYKAATGAYPGQLHGLPPSPRIGRTLDEARAVAVRTHPAIRQLQHEVKIGDLQVLLAEAATMPVIGLGSRLSITGDDVQSGEVGLSWRQTIYAGGQLAALQRKAIAQKERTRAGLRQTVLLVEQSVGNAWASLAVFSAAIEASDQQIRAAQAAFDGVREEANLGARTTLDVLDAEQELLDARASRLEAEANRYVAVYRVLSAMGLLTVDHLQLGIPTYDPEAYFNAVKKAPAHSARGKKLDEILEKIGE